MGTHEPYRQKKWLAEIFVLVDQVDRFRSGFAIRVNQVIPVSFYHREPIAPGGPFFKPFRIVLERFPCSWSLGFRTTDC